MSLLTLKDLKKHYGSQEVLSGTSLTIDPGAKIGIVGRNGGGKTTLLRMIEGLDVPDWGSVTLRKNARLGSVPQRPVFGAGVTTKQYVEGGLRELTQTIAQYEAISESMGSAEGEALERLLRQHDQLSTRVEELGGWEAERRVEVVLSGIGLTRDLWQREAETLSGGEKSRTALARELVAGHDLLLLDEPTNHLDLEGIEWIERFIAELRGAVLIVSHDRRLLENSVDAILELERGRLKRYAGNYSRYIQQKEERFQSDLRAWEVQQDFIRREEVFIKKHMGSQRTAEAKGRHKKLQHVERLEKPHYDVRRPVIRPPKATRGGELVLRTENLSGGYPDNVLFERVALRVGRGQRIGVVGPNGTGKSTLLKLLADRMVPLAGAVEHGHGATCSYYDQDTSALRDDYTPLSELRRDWPQMTDLEGRSHLARFLFRGKDIEKEIGKLSGGERARLCLAKLVLESPSWFALDEPTNHLDLAGRTALEEMLSEYQGALVCISHDREFLDGLCRFIIEVADGSVHEYEGNYSAWRATKEAQRSDALREQAERSALAKQAARKKEAAAKKRKTKQAKVKPSSDKGRVRNPYMFDKLEKRIITLEKELGELKDSMASEDVYRDPERLKESQFRAAEVENELQLANQEWEQWDQ